MNLETVFKRSDAIRQQVLAEATEYAKEHGSEESDLRRIKSAMLHNRCAHAELDRDKYKAQAESLQNALGVIGREARKGDADLVFALWEQLYNTLFYLGEQKNLIACRAYEQLRSAVGRLEDEASGLADAIDEFESEPKGCDVCNGTGESSGGPVGGACHSCGGSGVARITVDDVDALAECIGL